MVKGLADFQRRWSRIPEAVRINVAAELEDIADDIVAQMYGMAPQKSGDLAISIGWTWGEAPRGSLTIGTVRGRQHGGLKITIYAGGKKVHYARFQEFGTVKMPANPFFFPVWRARRRRVKSRVSRAIKKAVRTA